MVLDEAGAKVGCSCTACRNRRQRYDGKSKAYVEKVGQELAQERKNQVEERSNSMRSYDCFLEVWKDGVRVSMRRLTSEELVIAVDSTQARAKCLMMEGIAKAVAEDSTGNTRIRLVEINAL